MKAARAVIFVFLISVIAFGCSRKQEVSGVNGMGIEGEDKDIVTQTITSPEVVEPLTQPTAPAQTAQPIQVEAIPAQTAAAVPLETEGIERNKQIQIALKNANVYFGEIDGKIGPLTRKAIEEFQKTKGLKMDGKVGPITWGELQKYLNVQASIGETKNKR